MNVFLLSHTPDPQKVIAAAAKNCYSASSIENLYDGLTDEKATQFLDMLTEIGHASPIEHASFTFAIDGVSRSLLAQITRHRIASFSVQSQRYVKEKGFEYVVPHEIEDNEKAKEIFIKAMEDDQKTYEELTAILFEKHFETCLNKGQDEKLAKRNAEKMAIEDARYVLPNACVTKIVMTMNARSMQNFFDIRCCHRAQWEIRELAEKMVELCIKVAPTLFSKSGPSCTHGPCPEGNMTCGKIVEIRERYKKFREDGT